MKMISIAMLAVLVMPAWAAPTFTSKQLEVANVERAFAATMKARDHAAFAGFLSEAAVFSGEGKTLYGKRAMAEDWTKFYAKPDAPFSWGPDQVDVLAWQLRTNQETNIA